MKSPEFHSITRTVPRLVAAGLLLSTCSSGGDTASTTTESPAVTSELNDCETFVVYSQNRFQPYGTAVRQEPDVLSDKIGSFAPNEVIAIDGWYDSGESIYPTNTAPWDSSVWFRLDYDNLEGWVSFPGVRAKPSSPDESGGYSEYGGEPVELSDECEIDLE